MTSICFQAVAFSRSLAPTDQNCQKFITVQFSRSSNSLSSTTSGKNISFKSSVWIFLLVEKYSTQYFRNLIYPGVFWCAEQQAITCYQHWFFFMFNLNHLRSNGSISFINVLVVGFQLLKAHSTFNFEISFIALDFSVLGKVQESHHCAFIFPFFQYNFSLIPLTWVNSSKT